MPTQVPPGSALAIRSGAGAGGHRRVLPRGPRMLKFAEGGEVPAPSQRDVRQADRFRPSQMPRHEQQRHIDATSADFVAKADAVIEDKDSRRDASGAVIRAPNWEKVKALQSSGERVRRMIDDEPHQYAKGGLVRRKRAAPARLAYADGGLVDRWGQKSRYVPGTPQKISEPAVDDGSGERRAAAEAALKSTGAKERAGVQRRQGLAEEAIDAANREAEDQEFTPSSPLRRTAHLKGT